MACALGGAATVGCGSEGGPAPATVSIVLEGDGVGSVSGALECPGECSATLAVGDAVTLTAEPEGAGSEFQGWGGACVDAGVASTCELVLAGDVEVVARFALRRFEVEVERTGNGAGTVIGTVAGAGTSLLECGEDCAAEVPFGTTVVLQATPAVGSEPGAWTGCDATPTADTCEVRVEGATTVAVPFTLLGYAVEVDRDGSGDGTVASRDGGIDCGDVCAAGYDHGTEVTLDATPGPNSRFTGWTGDPRCGTDATCALELEAPVAVTAGFALLDRTLTVTVSGDGAGDVVDAATGFRCEAGDTCTTTYPHGTAVTLTARPDPVTSELGGFAGACTAAPCAFPMDGDQAVEVTLNLRVHTLTVAPAGTGTGVVSSSSPGIDCGADCTEGYRHGTMVTLTATPTAATSTFAGWSGGGCSGTSLTCTVAMDQARTVTATFTLLERRLTVARAGTGSGTVTSDVAGVTCGGDCVEDYAHGTPVRLTAAADMATSRFAGWSGDGCSGTASTCTVTMDQARTVTATFTLLERRLEVTRAGTGTGTVALDPAGTSCGGDCADFAHGTSVTLTATATAATSAFTGWSGGGCSGAATTCTVTMDRARAVTATFTLLPRRLDVRLAGTGSGTVTSSPSGISCGSGCDATFPHGSSVTLTATADAATSDFTGWSGACGGAAPTCTVTMDAARDAVATFTLLTRSLTVLRTGDGGGTVTGTGIDCGLDCTEGYAHGTSVTLTATEDDTSSFDGWSGACMGTGTCTVSMTAARTVIARFEPRVIVSELWPRTVRPDGFVLIRGRNMGGATSVRVGATTISTLELVTDRHIVFEAPASGTAATVTVVKPGRSGSSTETLTIDADAGLPGAPSAPSSPQVPRTIDGDFYIPPVLNRWTNVHDSDDDRYFFGFAFEDAEFPSFPEDCGEPGVDEYPLRRSSDRDPRIFGELTCDEVFFRFEIESTDGADDFVEYGGLPDQPSSDCRLEDDGTFCCEDEHRLILFPREEGRQLIIRNTDGAGCF